MAQFGHPELGGTGQWMRGGMTMVGDMFNASLQARVAALCEDMARLYLDHPDWQEVEARSGSPERNARGSHVAKAARAGGCQPSRCLACH